jgi:4-hydroxy-3-polyprenylbenzoate decarboxylase
MPPVPAFYLNPTSVTEIVDQIARRAIDLLHLFEPVGRQWHGASEWPGADETAGTSAPEKG